MSSSSKGQGVPRRAQSRELAEHEGETIELHGWVHDVRVLGKLTFIVMGDPYGYYQAVVKGDLARRASEIPRQSYVLIRGKVTRSVSRINPYEVQVESIEVLNEADQILPLDPASKVESELMTRINNRPLDLRNAEERRIFQIRARVLRAIRDFLYQEGFMEVDTPKIIATASEGGAELFRVDYFGRVAYLAQSPQLYKEELTLALGRVFEIAHYFRAEKSNTVKHLNEFTSVDVEAAMLSKEEVMDVLERLIKHIYSELRKDGVNVNVPDYRFPVYTYEEVCRETGTKLGEDLSTEALNRFGEKREFYFIVDWPLSLKPFYTMPKGDIYSESFDLMHRGLELASGGQRIHRYELLVERLKANGLDPESFSEHLKVYRWGMPPHSGWGLGLDRLMMVITNRSNIREVVLYPRDSKHLAP
ncbi:MAG: aspartate--tRNA(Asn) ligase [Nitrososphaeria archaeon]